MKRGMRRNNLYDLVFIFTIILLLPIIFAAHTITTSDGGSNFTTNESVAYTYNITVNNTDDVIATNITEVNVTFPSNFTFTADSNGTSTGSHTFVNTSTVLSWQNDSLVLNLSAQYFWFNLTSSDPGTYNLTVQTTNSSGTETTNISVTINDTTSPSAITYVDPTETNASNLSRSSVAVNVTATDNGVIDFIFVRLFNSTHDQINSSNSTTSPLYINFTGLSDGTYYFNATVNDTFGNENSTTTRNISVDTTVPLVSYGTGTETNNTNISRTSIYVNVSVTEANERNITFLLHNSTGEVNSTTFTTANRTINWTGLINGTYTFNVTVYDDAGNSNTTLIRTIYLDASIPNVTLISPAAAAASTQNYYNFTFNVTDTNIVSNCSLYLNGTLFQTLTTVNNAGATQGMYNDSLGVGEYNWSVNCTDVFGNVGNSSERALEVIRANATATATSSSGGGSSLYITLGEEALSKGYHKILYKNWKARFKVNNTQHNLAIKDVLNNSVEISVSSEPQDATIKVGEEKKFDVTGDNYYDLLVKLNEVFSEGTSSERANLTLQTIYEEIPSKTQPTTTSPAATQETTETAGDTTITGNATAEGSSGNLAIGIIVAVLVIALIVFLVVKKRK